MYKKTKIMTKHIQNILLWLGISLILSCFVVNVETTKPTTSQVNYNLGLTHLLLKSP